MSERCPCSYSRPETPHESLIGELKESLDKVLNSLEDPIAIEMALKFSEKLNIKSRVDDFQRHKDDISVYQKWKRLGLFLVIDTTSRIDYRDEENGLEIKKGDKILDIHLPPTSRDKVNVGNINNSMKMIAQYMALQGLESKYILGVTFERLAQVSKRFGFEVVEPQLPEDLKAGVDRVYQEFGNREIEGKPMGKILLSYQSTDNFFERFLTD